MVGRMCLAVTVTLAFPMLVIPARDIMLRSVVIPRMKAGSFRRYSTMAGNSSDANGVERNLQEPLLTPEELESSNGMTPSTESNQRNNQDENDDNTDPSVARNGFRYDDNYNNDLESVPFLVSILTSILIFWSAGTIASVVKSIDIVWDLLGSSLSILMSYLIPAGTFLVISKQQHQQNPTVNDNNIIRGDNHSVWLSRGVCWLLLLIFVPLMLVSTLNAIMNTFF